MKTTPRHLVQLSSAEIAFLHALVQHQMRAFLAERPEGRGVDPAAAPLELVLLDRRLLTRLKDVADSEEVFFQAGRSRPEAAWISEEHAALAEIAAPRARGGVVRFASLGRRAIA